MKRKLSHKVFRLNYRVHIWIEDHGDHFAVMIKNDLGIIAQPSLIAESTDRPSAQAHLDGIVTSMTPYIIEGSFADVTNLEGHI